MNRVLTAAEQEIIARYKRGLPVPLEYIGLIADALEIKNGFEQVAVASDAIIVRPRGETPRPQTDPVPAPLPETTKESWEI